MLLNLCYSHQNTKHISKLLGLSNIKKKVVQGLPYTFQASLFFLHIKIQNLNFMQWKLLVMTLITDFTINLNNIDRLNFWQILTVCGQFVNIHRQVNLRMISVLFDIFSFTTRLSVKINVLILGPFQLDKLKGCIMYVVM